MAPKTDYVYIYIDIFKNNFYQELRKKWSSGSA